MDFVHPQYLCNLKYRENNTMRVRWLSYTGVPQINRPETGSLEPHPLKGKDMKVVWRKGGILAKGS